MPFDLISGKFIPEKSNIWRDCVDGHYDWVQQHIMEGAPLNESDHCGDPPLLLAAGNGHLACVKLLLEEGADAEQRNVMKETPLSRAAHNGHLQMVRYLVEQGADVNCLDLGRLVLLAEDNLINQRVAKMMLSSLGMTVEVASNGQEAVEAIKRRIGQEGVRQFDVLLMDMAMPVMGGVDATKEIRRCGAVVPIVAMTANSSDKDRDECLESGMDGFLSKPVLKDRLAEALLTAVSGRRQFQDRGTISLKAYDQL